MLTKKLETFLAEHLETTKKQNDLLMHSAACTINLVHDLSSGKSENDTSGLTLIVVKPEELELLIQGLGNRKKVLRAKIRNNEGHKQRMDLPSWSEKELTAAINKRKVQLAETDMLKTRLENL